MAEMQFPPLSVMMPVRNEERHLEKAVLSILSQNYPGELEIILSVAPSVDKTEDVAKALSRKYPELKIIENVEGLTTIGLNKAIAIAKGEVIVRVDAHCELGKDYLVRGVEILKTSGASVLGGIMQARGETPIQRAVAFAYGSRFGIGGGSYHLGGVEGEAESAYLGIFDAHKLKAVNGYDESIIRGEDWDLSQRLKTAGGKIWFSPELKVDYWPRASVSALAWQFYSTGVWRGDLTRRDPRKASLRYFVPPLVVLGSVAGLLFVLVGMAVGILPGGPLFNASGQWFAYAPLSNQTFTPSTVQLGVIGLVLSIFPLAAYILLVLFAMVTAASLSIRDRLSLLLVLPTMHFSWGTGFWFGLIFGAGKTIDSGSKR
jgi:succinoglycan biosynthesis protein ExoA